MKLVVDGHAVHAYTGTRAPAAGQPTIVFVHGAANDHSVWALQSRWFAWHGCNVLAVDLPGHGRSGGAALASVEAIAYWLGELLDAAGVARATLVGHSLGSLAVLDAARQAPARVERLALLGTAVPMAVSDELLAAARDDATLAYALINGWALGPSAFLGESPLPGMSLRGMGLALMRRTAPGVLATDLAACAAYARGLEAAAAVRVPVLVLMGARDQMAPPKAAQALRDALPSPLVRVLPGVGHSLMTEAPDAVLDALRELVAVPASAA